MPLICEYEGCLTCANSGFIRGKPTHCSKHKLDGMTNVVNRRCMCGKAQPIFGLPNDIRATCCSTCKTPDMINIVSKRCICGKAQPRFGLPDDKQPTCCASCKTPKMIDIITKRCICGKSKPNFGLPDDKQPTCCSSCKTPEMFDIMKKRCICGKSKPNFGLPDDKQPTCCASCKTPDMIDIVNKRCICGKSKPNFGLPDDKQPTCCSSCKTPEMFDIMKKRCICGKSKPSFGLPDDPRAICCKTCKTPDMVDIVNKRCKAEFCDTIVCRPKYKGYCQHCFQHLFPGDPLCFQMRSKTKEIAVRDYLAMKFPDIGDDKGGFIHDKPLWLDACECVHKRRIDLRTIVNGTLLCIEIDEHEHRGYQEADEVARYHDLAMVHGGKMYFIRFNPDKFKDETGVRKNPEIATRLVKLETTIEKVLREIREDQNTELLKVIHLYYSPHRDLRNIREEDE